MTLVSVQNRRKAPATRLWLFSNCVCGNSVQSRAPAKHSSGNCISRNDAEARHTARESSDPSKLGCRIAPLLFVEPHVSLRPYMWQDLDKKWQDVGHTELPQGAHDQDLARGAFDPLIPTYKSVII